RPPPPCGRSPPRASASGPAVPRAGAAPGSQASARPPTADRPGRARAASPLPGRPGCRRGTSGPAAGPGPRTARPAPDGPPGQPHGQARLAHTTLSPDERQAPVPGLEPRKLALQLAQRLLSPGKAWPIQIRSRLRDLLAGRDACATGLVLDPDARQRCGHVVG